MYRKSRIFALLIMVFLVLILAVLLSSAFSQSQTVETVSVNSILNQNRSYLSQPITEQGGLQFPYLLSNISSLLEKSSFVTKAMIISRDANPTQMKFIPWGEQNKLTISRIKQDGIPLLRLTGTTNDMPLGFMSQDLGYRGKYISLIVGKSVKSPKDFQVTFSFSFTGRHGHYNAFFVHGPLNIKGWRDNNYYQKIDSFSSRLIDLDHLFALRGGQDNVILKRIQIVMQKNSTVNSMDFRVDLGRTTENSPVVLPGDNMYYVVGTISNYMDSLKDSKYIFHDLEINRIVTLEFTVSAPVSKVAPNGWKLIEILKSKHAASTNIIITAEKQIPFLESFPSIASKFDVYRTLTNLSSKDWLFSIIIVTAIILIPLGSKYPRYLQ